MSYLTTQDKVQLIILKFSIPQTIQPGLMVLAVLMLQLDQTQPLLLASQVHHLQMTLRSIFVIRLLQVQTSLPLQQQL
jgi:hypothetical protein